MGLRCSLWSRKEFLDPFGPARPMIGQRSWPGAPFYSATISPLLDNGIEHDLCNHSRRSMASFARSHCSTGALLLSPSPRTLASTELPFIRLSRYFHGRISQLKSSAGNRAPRRLIVRAARMESQKAALGFRAPDLQLPEPLTGKTWTLEDFEEFPALLVMFICNHCPFVKHLKKDIVKLSDFYMKKGLAVVAISSNSVITHPQDGPDSMAEDARSFGYPFPYLYDETQEVARSFGAVCTPEFLLFKKDGRRPFELVYHGQFDDSRPNSNVPVTGRDLSRAIDCVLSGQPVPSVQKPSIGCSIKWHP